MPLPGVAPRCGNQGRPCVAVAVKPAAGAARDDAAFVAIASQGRFHVARTRRGCAAFPRGTAAEERGLARRQLRGIAFRWRRIRSMFRWLEAPRTLAAAHAASQPGRWLRQQESPAAPASGRGSMSATCCKTRRIALQAEQPTPVSVRRRIASRSPVLREAPRGPSP